MLIELCPAIRASVHTSQPDSPKREERADVLAAQWHISGYLNKLLYYNEISVAQLKRSAVLCLTETSGAESTVGGPIQMATVTLAEGFKRIYEQEIHRLLLQNQNCHGNLRANLRELILLPQLH